MLFCVRRYTTSVRILEEHGEPTSILGGKFSKDEACRGLPPQKKEEKNREQKEKEADLCVLVCNVERQTSADRATADLMSQFTFTRSVSI